MRVRTVISMTVMVGLMVAAGCNRAVRLKSDQRPEPEEKIVQLQLRDGTILQFGEAGGRYVSAGSRVSGLARVIPYDFCNPWDEQKRPHLDDVEFVPRAVPADSVTQYWVQRTDPVATTVLVLVVAAGAVGLAVAIVAAAKDSCPFVYAYDGEHFVFDAEPLGGAICRGLRRTECSRLEHLQAVAGEYRLLLRNEVNETQYLDAMRLRVVDHAPEQWLVPDHAGNLHVVGRPIPPQGAHDEAGRDIARLLGARDGAAWLTHTGALTAEERDLRHHLTVQFPKPRGAQHARLVGNAGTALWGSNMIREMLQLRGAAVGGWYEEIERGGERLTELALFNLREELYLLRVRAERDSGLVDRGFLYGSGPFIAEDRVVEFDVSDLPGEALTLHLDPPKGFWTLDYLAVEYDRDSIAAAPSLTLASARDQDGRDIAGSLRTSDGQYYVMPRNGDWAELTFAALPPVADGQVRSIFLETDGYYEIQIDKSRPEATSLVRQLLNEPGAIVAYSIERYLDWRRQQASLAR